MDLEKRVKKIAETSGLAEKEVRALVEKRKDDAAGLLTDHGALYAIEKEYGIMQEEGSVEYTPLSELKPGLNNVNVVAIAKEVRPVKKFQTEKRSGQLARIILADASGEAPAVLWDKTAEIVQSDKVKPGTLIAIRNGYTRESLDKRPEIHVGGLSRIIIDPKNLDKKLLNGMPSFEEKVAKIGELKEGDIVTLQGRILYLYPKSEFQRSDGRTGQRSSMIIEDETGKTRVVLWDASADSISGFAEGDVVKIESGQVRSGNRGSEIHIGNRGRVLPSEAKMGLPPVDATKSCKIAEIQPNLQSITVSGRVMRIFPIKEFSSGERQGKLASVLIVDETGIARAVFWNEKTEQLSEVAQGDIITIKNAYTKQGMNGDVEVHLSQRGTIHVNPGDVNIPEVNALIGKHATAKVIENIVPDDRNIKITGKIEDVDENPIVFEICAECGARVENVAGEWMCDVCGETSPAYGMVVSCGVSDGTGDIRAVFYRDLAEMLTGLSVPDALNVIGQSGDETEPIRQIRDEIVGKRYELTGNVRYNDYHDRLELMVSSLTPMPGSVSNAPMKSVSKKKEDIPEDVPKDVLADEDIEIEEIKIDD